MAHYLALVDQTPDIVGVVIPDCPGCYAAGDTFEEALGNATEALDEWLADRLSAGFPAPRRRTAAELRADPTLAEDFENDAIVTLVPTGIGDVQPGPGLDRRLMADVNAAATRSGVTVAAFLAAAARDKLAAER